jgi:hypothetical protein
MNSIDHGNKKYFVITAGATGSGKTGLIKKTFKYLNIEYNENSKDFQKIFVDDLVEVTPKYKVDVKEIIEKAQETCNENEDDCMQNMFNNPSKELLEKFNSIYSTARTTDACLDTSISCDAMVENAIKYNGKTGTKHVIFETTGKSIPKWLLNSDFIDKTKYEIIFAYTLVGMEELIKRNKSRAYTSVNEFIDSNYDIRAPRLPDISKEKFKETINKMRTTLIELYNKCIHSNTINSSDCGDIPIQSLLIFSNNNQGEDDPIFDSNTNTYDDFQTIMNNDNYFVGNDNTGGKKRKTTRNKKNKRKSRKLRRKSKRSN